VQNLQETNYLVLLSSGSLCDVNPLIFRASRYVLWGEIKTLAFEDKKDFFSRMTLVLQRAVNTYVSVQTDQTVSPPRPLTYAMHIMDFAQQVLNLTPKINPSYL
jgi:hypothetical protein